MTESVNNEIMSRLRLTITFALVAYAALGGAVINQLHNHAYSSCDCDRAHHDRPCPVSIFFANFAGETSQPVIVAAAAEFVDYLILPSPQLGQQSRPRHESSRAPPTA